MRLVEMSGFEPLSQVLLESFLHVYLDFYPANIMVKAINLLTYFNST